MSAGPVDHPTYEEFVDWLARRRNAVMRALEDLDRQRREAVKRHNWPVVRLLDSGRCDLLGRPLSTPERAEEAYRVATGGYTLRHPGLDLDTQEEWEAAAGVDESYGRASLLWLREHRDAQRAGVAL